jgi:group I intron endonuclease
MNVLIYTLSDPRTNEVRYVGKTIKSLAERLNNHVHSSKTLKDHRAKWIQSLLKDGEYPIIEVLDTCCETDWQSIEKFWIITLKFLGVRLVNQNEGGCGNNGFSFSDASKAKISRSLTGKKQSPETIEKRASKMRGRKLSQDHINKSTATRISRNYKMSDKHKQKLIYINKNKKLSEEHKKLIAIGARINNEKNKKPVDQYSLNGEFITSFSCAGEASEKTFVNCSSIRMCCKGMRKKAGNFLWKFSKKFV